MLDGEYGIHGAAVGVPVSLGPGGAARIHEWDLQPEDLGRLRVSAALVAEVAAGPGVESSLPSSSAPGHRRSW